MDKLINRILSIEKDAEAQMDRTLKDLEKERLQNQKECDEIKASYQKRLDGETEKMNLATKMEIEKRKNEILKTQTEISDNLRRTANENMEKWVNEAFNKVIG